MHNNVRIIKPIAMMVAMIILVSSTACFKQNTQPISPVPTQPLYDSFDIKTSSLRSGNLHFNSFLTTDGSFIYFQSDDGKAMIKSEYDGKNPVVLTGRYPSFINVEGGIVFFIEGATSGKIFKIGTDGKGETMIVDVNAKSLAVTDQYLFFIDTKDGLVYYCRHDGSGIRSLYQNPATQFLLSENRLLVQPAGESKGIYSISLDALDSLNAVSTLAVDDTSPASVTESNLDDYSTQEASIEMEFESSANSTVPENPLESYMNFVKFNGSDFSVKSLNVTGEQYFYIDPAKNSNIILCNNQRQKVFVKKSIESAFILSEKFLYFINPEDESRIYSVSADDSSDQRMIVNDRVSQFVVCGNSIYYRRANNLEIYRTPVDGGISFKIT